MKTINLKIIIVLIPGLLFSGCFSSGDISNNYNEEEGGEIIIIETPPSPPPEIIIIEKPILKEPAKKYRTDGETSRISASRKPSYKHRVREPNVKRIESHTTGKNRVEKRKRN